MKDFDLKKYLAKGRLLKEELEEIDMTISSEAVESSVKQGLNQMFERLADIVDNKKEASIQSETLGVTNYIKRLMREYAKYADNDIMTMDYMPWGTPPVAECNYIIIC